MTAITWKVSIPVPCNGMDCDRARHRLRSRSRLRGRGARGNRTSPVQRFTIGEPDGSTSERVVALRDTLVSAGFEVPIRDTIRWSIWLKLWANSASIR